MKLKTPLVFILFTLFVTNICIGQEFGIKAGLNQSNRLKKEDKITSDFKTGWHAGVYYVTSHEKDNFQVEMFLSKKVIDLLGSFKVNHYYTEFNFLWKRHLKDQLHFITGLQFGSYMGSDLRPHVQIDPVFLGADDVFPKYRYQVALPVGFIFDFNTLKLGLLTEIDISKKNVPHLNIGFSLYYTWKKI